MDIGFEVLLVIESKIPTIKFEHPVYEWQGEKYPQGQQEAWVQDFKLIKSSVPQHILSFLPEKFQKESWQCISIVDGIEEIVEELSVDREIVKKEDKLLALLTSLVGDAMKWVVIFEPDHDRIDQVIEGNIDLVYQKIVESLVVEKSGFVIWFDKSC